MLSYAKSKITRELKHLFFYPRFFSEIRFPFNLKGVVSNSEEQNNTLNLHHISFLQKRMMRKEKMILRQMYSQEYPEVQFAFKNSMIHVILQFTLPIAFRCVLHRCQNQEIHC
jgi:hypothetical protein